MSESQTIVRRCKGWAGVHSKPFFFVDGSWMGFMHSERYFGDSATFTDTLCPDCHAAMLRQLATADETRAEMLAGKKTA